MGTDDRAASGLPARGADDPPQGTSGLPAREGNDLPRRTGSVPTSQPGDLFRPASALPDSDGSPESGTNPLPRRTGGLPTPDSGFPAPNSGFPAPDGGGLPRRAGGPELPVRGSAGDLPSRSPGLPQRSPAGPAPSAGLPQRSPAGPAPSAGLPQRSPAGPAPSAGLPQRSPAGPAPSPGLPSRTLRYRRSGRHRSPHQLSVPSDAPALVLAVPGNASPEGAELAGGIAAVASKSCPGVPVLAGYMTGREQSLTSVLARCRASDGRLGAVVVPLLICAQPAAEAAIAAAVAQSGAHALMAGPLGVHPLLAGALHARLAESGLARSDRIGRISIATPADGVLVAATGDDAVSAAGTLAVLLAGRLAVPVAPASFSDRASLADGVTRLREAGVSRMALAPCIIGPETWPVELAEVSGQYALHPAAPLGSHDAVGQMAAVRYGTVLQDPQLAGLPG